MARTAAAINADIASNAAAISRAESAQSVGSDGTNASQANLKDLYDERRRLWNELRGAEADPTVGGSGMFARTRVTGIGGILS